MSRDIVWKLVVDDQGAIKKMELVGKEGKKTDEELKKTKKGADNLRLSLHSLGNSFGGLKSMIGMSLGGVGFAGLGFGLESIVSKTGEMAQEVEKFHTATGMGAQSSLDYVAALKARGVGTEAVVRGYKTLGKAIQSAERQETTHVIGQEKATAKGHVYTTLLGVQAEAFQELGVNFTRLKALKPEKQFQEITEKFEKLPAGIEKTRLATQLFGRGGTALLPVLEKGGLSLKHYRMEAERFFPTLKGGKNVMNEVIQSQSESKMAWEGLEFTLGTAVAPALVKVERTFSSLIGEAEHGKGPLGELIHTFEGIASWAGKAEKFIKGIGKDLGVKLPSGTLGAILGMAGLHVAKHPIKSTTTLLKGAKDAAKYGVKHPEMLPFIGTGIAGLAGAYGTVKGIQSGAEVIHPGILKERSQWEWEKLLGLQPLHRPAYGEPALGQTQLRGVPAHETAADRHYHELVAIRNAIIELHDKGQSGHQIIGEMHMDSTKIGEVIALNPRAMRFLAEGIERASKGRRAR